MAASGRLCMLRSELLDCIADATLGSPVILSSLIDSLSLAVNLFRWLKTRRWSRPVFAQQKHN